MGGVGNGDAGSEEGEGGLTGEEERETEGTEDSDTERDLSVAPAPHGMGESWVNRPEKWAEIRVREGGGRGEEEGRKRRQTQRTSKTAGQEGLRITPSHLSLRLSISAVPATLCVSPDVCLAELQEEERGDRVREGRRQKEERLQWGEGALGGERDQG